MALADFPALRKSALRLLSLPPSAACAERNWSTQDFIFSKRRNRLASVRGEKLVYIYYNIRSLLPHEQRTAGLSAEKLASWLLLLRGSPISRHFPWPTRTDGQHMVMWDTVDDDAEFAGMHGDEDEDEDEDEKFDESAVDALLEQAAFQPYMPDDNATPGTGIDVLECPTNLPGDLVEGGQVALWFGPPYNKWFAGKIIQVNRRRTVSENVTAEFVEDGQPTWAHFTAARETYGADRRWVLLKRISIDLDDGPAPLSSPAPLSAPDIASGSQDELFVSPPGLT